MKLISIMIPCYNEAKSLPLLYQELNKVTSELSEYDWEFLFIDDGSKDSTLEVIKSLRKQDDRVKFIGLSRNFGKESAMLAGFDFVKGDAVIIMDADLQHPPTLIPKLLEEWNNNYLDIYAKRLSRGRESWIRKRLSMIFYGVLQKTTNVDVLPNVGDFRLLDRKCINALREYRETGRYTKGMFSLIGFKKKDVPFETNDRAEGNSSWNFFKLFNFALDGITSFTVSPLRISAILGFIISLFAFAYMIFILIRTVIYGDEVKGFPTLIIIILFLGGIQLISLGIIGEYIGRIFNETKKRPIYIIDEKEL